MPCISNTVFNIKIMPRLLFRQFPLLGMLFFILTGYAQDSLVQKIFYYPSNQYQLNPNQLISMTKLPETLLTSFAYRIVIEGHADSRGKVEYNNLLSQKRAVVIKDILLSKGIPDSLITIEVKGVSQPLVSNDTKSGRALNRRSVINLFLNAKLLSEVNTPGSLSDLYALIAPSPQRFCIDVERDTFLVGEKGTIVHYKANTIKSSKVKCPCLTIELNEYFDKADLILNNLTTTSDGDVLQSGGMIKLSGYCDSEPYSLKPSEFLTVMVPADTILPDMRLFSADRKNSKDYLNWQIDTADMGGLEFFDWDGMRWACGLGVKESTAKCPFFFCQIKHFFTKLWNLDFRRKYNPADRMNNRQSDRERAIIKKYDFKEQDLLSALQTSKENSKKDVLKYYMYKNYSWEYRNIDRYEPGIDFITFKVTNKPDTSTDIKIIYKNTKTVVPSFEKKSSYIFEKIENNVPIWVVGLRYINEEIYLALLATNTGQNTVTIDFKKVTVDELKAQLKVLN